MELDLFAGVAVSDRARAIEWYSRLLSNEPAFLPNDDEAVWELAPHRYLYVDVRPASAGHSIITAFVADLAARVEACGVEPDEVEDYDNGVSKVIFHDPDGNEISFAGSRDHSKRGG